MGLLRSAPGGSQPINISCPAPGAQQQTGSTT